MTLLPFEVVSIDCICWVEILDNGTLLHISPNSAVSDIPLVAWNWPWHEYLYHRNWQMLQSAPAPQQQSFNIDITGCGSGIYMIFFKLLQLILMSSRVEKHRPGSDSFCLLSEPHLLEKLSSSPQVSSVLPHTTNCSGPNMCAMLFLVLCFYS